MFFLYSLPLEEESPHPQEMFHQLKLQLRIIRLINPRELLTKCPIGLKKRLNMDLQTRLIKEMTKNTDRPIKHNHSTTLALTQEEKEESRELVTRH